MADEQTVQQYIAMQPKIAWRRHIMRWLIRTFVFRILARVTVTGEENVPATQPGIVIINHISYLDPVLGMGAVNNRFCIPMSKAENRKNPLLAFLIWWWGSYYVNRGAVDRTALMNSIELIKSGQLILIAPEGTRQPSLTQPKDGFSFYATKSDATIVPMAITGVDDAWIKKILTLQRPKIQIVFGRPFRFKTEGRTRIPREELTAMTDEAMYQLSSHIRDEKLRGEYSDLSKATTQYLEFVKPE
ncbi:MAG: 1-acyl-sn-glycerol-3-phosphate acyltransferase [Pleurocapsa minor GSE-CHR-MK-17-07R]|nr:1-acyl-sn-glycerol-3-phosphate acyltransferase [Pleurocapsa minor GSE-CHR-MK 17-07R]